MFKSALSSFKTNSPGYISVKEVSVKVNKTPKHSPNKMTSLDMSPASKKEVSAGFSFVIVGHETNANRPSTSINEIFAGFMCQYLF